MKAIRLSRGQIALVDDEDYEAISTYPWYATKKGVNYYATRTRRKTETGKRRNITMHQALVGKAPRGMEIDHTNGNSLDNRRCNLRICTHAENQRNQRPQTGTVSRFKGVRVRYENSKHHGLRKYIHAYISYNDKYIHIGAFATEEEAARAYDKRAKELFGEFARPNFPEEVSGE